MQLTSITPATISSSGSLTRGVAPPAAQGAGGAPPVSSSAQSTASPGTVDTQGVLAGDRVSIQRSVQPGSSTPESGDRTARPSEGRSGEGAPSAESAGNRPGSNGARPESERTRPESDGNGRNNQSERSSGQPSDTQQGQRDDDGGEQLSPEERSELSELRARDLEVRQHEQAHQAVGGQFAGPVSFTFERGPNGQLFAIGGQVSIDTSPVPDEPEATINKMQVVRAAALAPAEPSPQDIQVAQEATSQMLEARAELRTQQREEVFQDSGPDSGSGENSDDPRLDLFRSVDRFSTDAAPSENGSRFAATA